MLTQVRVISWNLHGPPFAPRRPERMSAAATEAARRGADLLLLQEVWFPADAARLIDQLGPDYDSITVPRGALFGRKGGLLAFLRRSSSWSTEGSVARFEQFRATASPFIFWQGDGLGKKGVQVIELRHRSSEQRLFVLNTHLQAQYGEDTYEDVRRSQLGQLAAVASDLETGVPILAAGDINTRPEETAVYTRLTDTWEDLSAELRRQCGRGTAVHHDAATKEWIDYVVAWRSPAWQFSARVELIANRGVDDPYSDHEGLDATIDIRPSTSASPNR